MDEHEQTCEKLLEELADLRCQMAVLEAGDAPPAGFTTTGHATGLRLETVLETMSDGLLVLDENMRVVYFNKAAETRLRRRREDVLGRHMFDEAFPQGKGTLFEQRLTEALCQRAEIAFESNLGTAPYANGYEVRVFPHEGGLAVYLRVTTHDEREKLIAQLEAKNAELERFTYTVSHDLRSPLITIDGFANLLRKSIADGDMSTTMDDIQRICDAAERMERLLKELLELSRIGRATSSATETSLNELAGDALAAVSGQVRQRGVCVDVATDMPAVFGDRLRLTELVQNLIDNAVKYMGDQPRPRIEIGCRATGAETVCYVRDNGIGIDPRDHQRVFELFSQLDREAEGTGVGLALAQRIVEVHEGRIWIESEGLGHGSTFCFSLPANRPLKITNMENTQP
ncbi:MAG: PAS domain-containing protein [Planctomycetes bacterium]|nr:PAS domain-containing protein [Planctomycetota bacterium]